MHYFLDPTRGDMRLHDRLLPPFEHQATSIRKGLTGNILFDTSDPGTGKTRVQIDLAAWRTAQTGAKTLVIAPKSLLYSAWYDDFQKFAPHLRISVANANNRAKAFEADADVYVTNTDAVTWLLRQGPNFLDDFDSIVVDESSKFKNPKAKRTKALITIASKFQYRACLTGTPSPNEITDLFTQVYVLDGGRRLGRSYYAFRNTCCTPVQVGSAANMVKWVKKDHVEHGITGLLADITIRNVLEDCVDIPEHSMHMRKVKLPGPLKKLYDSLAENAIIQVNQSYITGVNAATLRGKLLQACAGTVYDEDGNTVGLDSTRTDLVVELAEERQHCVVFFQWRHQRDALMAAFKKAGLTFCLVDGSVSQEQRRKAVKDFQGGLYKVFLAQPAAAAHGLTLTRATTTIWTSLGDNLENFIQGNRRIYRAGQKKKTETIVICADDTVETKVYENINNKDKIQSNVLNLLEMLS